MQKSCFLSTTSRLLKYEYPEIPPEDEPHIVKSPYSQVEIPEMNLADFVWKDVDKWPERTALVNYSFACFILILLVQFYAVNV